MNNMINKIIKEKDLKVKKVIVDSGISKSAFYLIANGESVPSLSNARKISTALGLSVDEVFPNDVFKDD